jgi:hypothetical protein
MKGKPTADPWMSAPAHPGFQSVKKRIAAQEGIPEANAAAILAASTRKASPAAKKRNPKLARVKGGGK